MGILDAPGYSRVAAEKKFAKNIVPGSDLVRSMISAAVLSPAPTLSASTTAPAAYTRTVRAEASQTNYWPGFRVSGAPLFPMGAGTAYPRNARKTTDAASAWGGCARVEFDLYSDGFAFTLQVPAGAAFKLWVNERPHAANMQLLSSVSGATGTGTNHFSVDFGSVDYRRIVLEWASLPASPTNFQGIRVKPTAALFPPSIPSPRFMTIGDSYNYGIGATDVGDALAIQLGRHLGFADIWNFTAVPSTGPIKADTPNSFGNYNSRFAVDVLPNLRAGDVCVYFASVNDGGEAAGVAQAQMITDLTALKAAKPDTNFIVASDVYMTTPTAAHTRIRDEASAAAASVGLPFVNLMDTTLNLWTGTGTVTATTGDGPADFFAKDVGGIHPTSAGARALAREAARQMAPILGQTR